jgi:uncharacterized membrane protein YvlD (DUF360 family)
MYQPRTVAYGQEMVWKPRSPRFRPVNLLVSWLLASVAVLFAAAILPGLTVGNFADAAVDTAVIASLNAVLPPLVAALRLPYTLALGFLLVLVLDAVILLLASQIDSSSIKVDSFGWALLASLVIAAASVALEAVLGVDDEDTYTLRVIRRIARRRSPVQTQDPGIVCLEIDGLALPVLQRAMRDGNAPELSRWLEDGTHQLLEWETDFSSQTGASQAGILLGANENIPAFRWVEKDTGRILTCSAPADCAEIERRHSTGRGLLIGGASRGNLLSGEADEVILTVSRLSAEKRANPGYRTFLANGTNVTRALVLFGWEVVLELVAASRQRRRDVRPRGHRGGRYPFIRAGVCVVIRDLIVFGVLTDMMRGTPAVYATFSSYDEVAHHSGLERPDTLEALRKLDQQIGRIARARRFAPRPYELVVLSDHGQTQGTTFKQRNGYSLGDLVGRSIEHGGVSRVGGGDETDAAPAHAWGEATGRIPKPRDRESGTVGADEHARADPQVIVLGSGNLGLVYLMDSKQRLTAEEIEQRHPRLLAALREHPHIGFVLVRSSEHGAVALGRQGTHYLTEGRVVGEDPLEPFSSTAAQHLLRSDGFRNVADIMVNSFYDPDLDQACAFEELISFHGGMGGSQTRPFLLAPVSLPLPPGPIIGATAVHRLLSDWRQMLAGPDTATAEVHTPVLEKHATRRESECFRR